MPPEPPNPRAPKPNDPTSAVDPSPVQPGARAGGHPRAPGPLPEHVGSYRILRELGHGGMGVVYLATRDDVALNRLVALKLVHRGMASPGVLERFERERQVLGALNHPNIARLLDGGTSDRGEPYFVMEYVEGRPIDEYCDARRLTIGERLALFRQVCAAVHHAHQNLVVHRDIKPRNILVTAEGVPKLLDFGIAKLLNPSMAPSLEAPTQTGLRLMTPEYASPEQVKGLPITTATDVYSLGVVLFELLTGHRPYRLRTRIYHEVERIICEEEPQKPSTAITRVEAVDHGADAAPDGAAAPSKHAGGSQMITPEAVGRARRERPPRLRRALEGDIDNIVLMALRKEPQRRYASVEQFAEDIRRHLEGHTVIARADTPGYRAAKFVRRHRAAVLSAGLVTVALLAGLTTTLWQWRVAADNAAELGDANRDLQAALDAKQKLVDETLSGTEEILAEGLATIAKLPESIEAQRWFATLVRSWLERIQATTTDADSARLREALAESLHRIGTTQAGRRGQNQGDIAAALASHREGHDIRAGLVQESPGDPERRMNLAASKLLIADVLRERDPIGSRADAQREIDAALDIAESAANEMGLAGALAVTPAMSKAADRLARALVSKCDAECDAGRLDAARSFGLRAIAVFRTAFADRLEDTAPRRGLANANYHLATVEHRAGRLGEALQRNEAALSGYEPLATSQGGVSFRRNLMNSQRQRADILRSVGDEQLAGGDSQAAKTEYLKSVEMAERAVSTAEAMVTAPRRPGSDIRPAIDLALSLQTLGLGQRRASELDAALTTFRRAVATMEADLADAEAHPPPALPNIKLLTASTCQNLVEALLAPDTAVPRGHEAVDAARRAVALYGTRVKPGSDPLDDPHVLRATAYLGLALIAAGEGGEGRSTLTAVRDGYHRLAEKEPHGEFEAHLLARIEAAL